MKETGQIKWRVSISAKITQKGKITKKALKELDQQIARISEDLSSKLKEKDKFSKFKVDQTSDNDISISTVFQSEMPSMHAIDFAAAGVGNIMKWFRLNIDDRDWDHAFIIDALRFKIRNTCDYIKKAQRHENWENDVRYMEIALSLMERIWPREFSEVDSYESEYQKYHVSEVNWVDLDDEEEKNAIEALGPKHGVGCKRMEVKEISENFKEYFAKNKRMHKQAIQHIKKTKGYTDPKSKLTQALVIGRLKHEKAKKLLFKVLSEKLETWWD